MKKVFILVVMIGIVCFIGFGFVFLPSPDREWKGGRIAVIMPSANDKFWNGMWVNIREAADKKGMLLSEYPYDYDESERNVMRELEKVILSRPDGILLSANQYTSETIQALLVKAREQDIKIILCDSDAETPMRDCFVGSDNVESGKNVARLALEEAGSGEILVFIGSDEKDSKAAQVRLDAFRAEIESRGDSAKIKEIRLSDDAEEHYDQICGALLERRGENRTVVCFKSSFTTVIAQAIQRLGLQDTCKFFGFCESEEAFTYASSHVIDVLFVQDIVQLGYQAVECMDKLLQGEPLETDMVLIDMDVYGG